MNRPYILLLLGFWLSWAPALCVADATGRVDRVYDGDTLEVVGIGKVRLIGIDAPERERSSRDSYYWQKYRIPANRLRRIAATARAYTLQNVKGKKVRLEFDRQKHDRYGRTLAYLYLPDGTLLNLQLIRAGLASVYRRFDFRLKQELLAAEKQAQAAGIGLWTQ